MKFYGFLLAVSFFAVHAANQVIQVSADKPANIAFFTHGAWMRVPGAEAVYPNAQIKASYAFEAPLRLRWTVQEQVSKPAYASNPDWGPTEQIGTYQVTEYHIYEVMLSFVPERIVINKDGVVADGKFFPKKPRGGKDVAYSDKEVSRALVS